MQVNFMYYKPRILILIIVLLWAVSSRLLSFLGGYGLLNGIGPSAIVMLFLFFYDKCLWKLPVFKLMNTVPNLNGIYEGCVSYFYEGYGSEKSCRLEIKQTCSMVSVKCFFAKDGENETQSESKESFIITDSNGKQKLFFYYQNRGSGKNGDSLNLHDGVNILDISKEDGLFKLDGYYFTNREPEQTKGLLKVSKLETKE